LALRLHLQPHAGDCLYRVGDEGEELDALGFIIHPPAVRVIREVNALALARDPDLPRGALGVDNDFLSGCRGDGHHVTGAVGVQQVRVHLVQRPKQPLEGVGDELVVAGFVHGVGSSECGGDRLTRGRKEEKSLSSAVLRELHAYHRAGWHGSREGLHRKKMRRHRRHGGVVPHQDEVRLRVRGEHYVQATHRHVGQQTSLCAERDFESLGEREDLRSLHGTYQGTGEDERHSFHLRFQRNEVGIGRRACLGCERARCVVQALWHVRVGIGVPHQENSHALLVHEPSAHGQRLGGALAALLLAVLMSAGCRVQPQPPARDDGGPASVLGATADAGPYRLSAAKLDAFLVYKRVVLEGGEPSVNKLRELLRAVDGGEPGAVEQAWEILRVQGAREAAARTQTGLSAAEVRAIEPMAADVAAARVFARPLGLGKLSEDLAAARNSLPQDKRAGVDATLATLREDEARLERLADEREAWGDANVDLLLSREKQLVVLYEAQVRGARERMGSSHDAGR
jgi:hypothetical protein